MQASETVWGQIKIAVNDGIYCVKLDCVDWIPLQLERIERFPWAIRDPVPSDYP